MLLWRVCLSDSFSMCKDEFRKDLSGWGFSICGCRGSLCTISFGAGMVRPVIAKLFGFGCSQSGLGGRCIASASKVGCGLFSSCCVTDQLACFYFSSNEF
jgi:hypothetical protein